MPVPPDDVDSGEMLWGDGFEVETLINVRIAKAGLPGRRSAELRAEPRLRDEQSQRVSDGIRVLRTIHVERTRGTRKASMQSAAFPRRAGTTWSRLSTVDDIVD